MKIKRKDLYAFFNIVGNAQFDTSKPLKTSFRYMLSKNLKKCKAEMEETDALFPAPAGYEDYLRERVQTFQKFGLTVNPNGTVAIEQIRALGPEKEAELSDLLSKLTENNRELIEQVDILNAEKFKFVEEEVEIDFEKVPITDVPDISEKEPNHWEIWNLLERIAIK